MRILPLAALAAVAALTPAAAETSRERSFERGRPSPAPVAARRAPVDPVRYEPNLGQWDGRIRCLGRASGLSVLLADGEAIFRGGAPASAKTLRGPRPGGMVPAAPSGDLRMAFVGGRSTPRIEASGLRTSVSNYFLGADRARWRTSVPHYGVATYRDLWPGIDLAFRGDPLRVEYDLHVAPGADLGAARLRFAGHDALRVDDSGDLVLAMGEGEFRHAAPRLWQDGPAGRREVSGSFRVHADGTVGFSAGEHDRALALVVDPVVDYATYLGGSIQDWADDVAVDASGNMVVSGWTDSTNFPLNSPLQSVYVGGGDASVPHVNDGYVAKYSADGQTQVFSTYFGGNGFDDCLGVATDGAGDILVCGLTSSTDFPTSSPLQAATGGGYDDMYVTKIAANGQSLVFSTYFGSAGQDEAYDIAVNASGIFLAGGTSSGAFPVVGSAQLNYGGGAADAIVAKINLAGNGVSYATWWGGSGQDLALGVAVDSSGSVRAVGETASSNFPTSGGVQSTFGGSGPTPFPGDAFLLRLDPTGVNVVFSTYFGASLDDYCDQVCLDASGNAFIAGQTSSQALPLVNPLRSVYGGGSFDGWIAKINATGNSVLFCTYWGGSGTEFLRGMGLDPAGDLVFCGLTTSTDFPLSNAFQGTYQGGTPVNNDGYIVKLDGTGSTVRYSSYFGSNGADDPQGMAILSSGAVAVVGLTNAAAFPVQSPVQATYGGGNFDSYLLRITPVPPTAPSVLVASQPGNGSVQLNWVDTSTTETRFEIEKKTGAGPFSLLANANLNVQSYQDFAVAPNTTYTYRVRAANADGTSAWTNEASATTGASIAPPTSPNNLQVTVVSATQNNLTWTDRSSNETLFEVERKIVPGTFETIASPGANTVSYSDTTLGPDSPVVYRVRAVGVTSQSAYTNEVTVLTLPSLGLTGVKGSITDSATAAKDVVNVKGFYAFLPASPDDTYAPLTEGIVIHVGSETNPAVLTIPPNDPAWVVKKTKATWKTPKESSVKVTVAVDTVKGTFSVKLSNITFPGEVTNPVRVSIRCGNDGGSVRAVWVNKKPGKFSYKQP